MFVKSFVFAFPLLVSSTILLPVASGKKPKTKPDKGSCPDDKDELMQFGTDILTEFWMQVLDAECDPDAIADIYKDYFTGNLAVTAVGNPISADPGDGYFLDSRRDVVQYFVYDTGAIPGLCIGNGAAPLSWVASDAEDIDGGSFLWLGDEFVGGGSLPRGYTFNCGSGKISNIEVLPEGAP